MGLAARTTLVVPCYNEAARLDRDAFSSAVLNEPNLHLLFVNDGSTDGTREVLEEVCARAPAQMSRIDMPRNSGKAEAVRSGMLRALNSEASYLGFWDADLATPLDAVPAFAHIFDRDPSILLVMGSRVKLLGRHIDRRMARHYLGRVFATFASMTLGLAVYDTQCGAKLFRKTLHLSRVFSRPFAANWTFDVEILARLLAIQRLGGGFRVESSTVEYPLEKWTDVKGSKVSPLDFVIALAEVARITWFLHGPGRERRWRWLIAE